MEWAEIPHDRIFVAEVARLRGFDCLVQPECSRIPEFLQIRLHSGIRLQEPHYFFSWGISMEWGVGCTQNGHNEIAVR